MSTYIPIIRPGPVEQATLMEFWNGLSRFQAEPSHSLSPFLELTDIDELDNLEEYSLVGERFFIDIPTYLLERRTKYSDEVDEIVDQHGDSVNFFQEEDIDECIPVISTNSTDVIEYETLREKYRTLRSEFETLAIRPFIGGPELDPVQRESLNDLFDEIRPEDVVLLDIVDVAGFEGSLYSNLEFVTGFTTNHDTYTLNAFQPRQGGRAHNYGPVLADDLGVDGFGDFVLEPRFPSAGGQPTETRIIRHYSSDQFELEIFTSESGGYEEAFEQLQVSDYWGDGHCQFCREANSDWNEGHRFWKRIRMGHYIHSIFIDTLQQMDEQSGEDLDMDGYQYVHRRIDDADET